MIKQLTVAEQDYSFSLGFIEQWLKGAKNPPTPSQVMEHLTILSEGIATYREKYIAVQEDYDKLQGEYNRLMATSAQHLEFMSQQKQQLDEALIREQRAYQEKGTENLIDT